MGKKSKIFLGIGSIVLVLALAFGLFYYYAELKPRPAIGISGFYDENGNRIDGDTQAIVGGVPGVHFITIDVNARNNDDVPLTFSITEASPPEFSSQIALNEQREVASGDFATWTSGLISVEPFIGTTTRFEVSVLGSSPFRRDTVKTSYLDIVVEQDNEGEFDVDLDGGGEQECSSNADCDAGFICQEGQCIEDQTNPPPSNNYVIFRTSDTTYGSASAVAYATSCGGVLTRFGDRGLSSWDCGASGTTMLLETIPGNAQLCLRAGYSTRVYVTKANGDTRYYDSADSDAGAVSDSILPLIASNEVLC